MTEQELRTKCGLGPGGLIETNLGLLDILRVENGEVTFGVLVTGRIINESIGSVVVKLTKSATITKT